MDTISIYLHIPFCQHRCAYCDFNTYAGLDYLIDPYVKALCTEIRIISNQLDQESNVKTIFFGGGTPSLLSSEHFQTILRTLDEEFIIPDATEITIEANPGTVSLEYLASLRQLGINRISFGLQSVNPNELLLLEREHTYSDAIQGVQWARKAGFNNLNLDLIFGLPGQTMHNWQHSLKLANGLNPEHFSLYALTIESGTPLGTWLKRGLLPIPDLDLAADMYEWASDFLLRQNFTQYEISNWARPSSNPIDHHSHILQCEHNLQYWLNLPYFGFGAGAHGFAGGIRTANVSSLNKYINCMQDTQIKLDNYSFPTTPATESTQIINRDIEIGETMMMGLRLIQTGVSRKSFQERFGESLEKKFGEKIKSLTQLGLLEWSGKNREILRLTKKGRLLGNQVFLEFI